MGITREILLSASHNQWLARQLSSRRFTRSAVKRFLPGEDLDSALEAAAALGEKEIPTILTLLGENVTSAAEAEEVVRHFLGVLERVREQGLEADISVKPTHFGLDLDVEGTYDRIRRLVGRAAELGKMVAVDMEDSSYLERTLDLYRRLRSEHANVAICLQSYLFRTAQDVEALLPLKPTIRLVKGAYKEPRAIAYRRKKDVDASFITDANRLLEQLELNTGVGVFFGTHDPRMIEQICERAEALGVPKDAFEIQMLYGIKRDLQLKLAAEGYRVRVLISYGDSWFPWFVRRLAERPANLLFVLRNLFG